MFPLSPRLLMPVVLHQLDSGQLSSEGSLCLLDHVQEDQGSFCLLDLVQEEHSFLCLQDPD